MKTGIITTNTYLNHDTGQGHPERADRVTVVIDHLKKVKSKNLIWKKPAKFDLKYLEYAHDKNYLNNVTESFPKQGLNFLDGDTIVSPGSKEATKDAVGSILTAIDGTYLTTGGASGLTAQYGNGTVLGFDMEGSASIPANLEGQLLAVLVLSPEYTGSGAEVTATISNFVISGIYNGANIGLASCDTDFDPLNGCLPVPSLLHPGEPDQQCHWQSAAGLHH